ncbi:caprin-2-like [Saccostrea cucullata]|uniref:caprin-2-like n=1 Tax=Saccostrea cuccullata TaxID=36930 RepID=UPI002ED3A355
MMFFQTAALVLLLSALGNVEMSGDVIAFNAYITKTLHLKEGTLADVVYDGLYYNHGDAYDQQTGVFTAPSNGLYVFTWSSCVAAKKIFDVELLLNGKRTGLGNCNNVGGKGYANCSNTFPLVLKAGDKVNIRTTKHADYLHQDFSSFSGWKV